MKGLWRLWHGRLPVADAFWSWAVIGGIAVNGATTIGSLILFSLGATVEGLVVGYGLSVPYNLIVIAGVWRCADNDTENPQRAGLYRVITVIGMTVLSLT